MKSFIAFILFALSFAANAEETVSILPDQTIPVIIYHRVTDTRSPSDTVISPTRFEEHLQAIQRAGYSTVTVSQLTDFILKRIHLPRKTVTITFDDGWKDQLEAAKMLAARDMAATFFVMSGALQDPAYFDKDDVVKLAYNPRFEIGSHTHTHFAAWAKNLSALELSMMLGEAFMSKKILEDVLARPVQAIAWPFGYTTLEAVEGAMRLGYTSTSTVNSISRNSTKQTPQEIYRLNVSGLCSAAHLITMLETGALANCEK